MTPEEKAKRYNETLEMTKNAHKDEDRHLKATLERTFPELKENKDEKTKKAIIDIIKSQKEQQCHIDGAIYDKMIAWLEKQGRHANFRNKIQIGDKVTRNEDGALVNLSQLKRIAKEYNITGIGSKHAQGKLGEMIKNLKPVNETLEQNHANKVEPKDYSSIDPHFFKPTDKVETKDYNNIDPHFDKPADKVEPKFHEGQWIVWQGKNFKVNYNGCGYELTDQNGKSTSLEYGAIDETANLWTIQDAKDDDVLVYNNSIFIFNEIYKNWLIYYGIYENDKFRNDKCYSFLDLDTIDINNIHPAAKEQREQLEKAMDDAGYAFDFEKKELKKIEDEIEIPFGAKDSELQEATYYIPKGFHAEIDDDKVVVKKGEKPTAWSEMDKAITRAISSNLELLKNRGSGEVSEAVYQSEIKWLKALKRRVGYDEEWSEEDETALGDTLWAIEQAKTVAKNESEMGNIWYAERWLKSLKYRVWPKNNYNPYKEVVESIAKMCEKYDKYSHSILKDFFDNVKVKCKDAKEFDSLHPQNTKTISQ